MAKTMIKKNLKIQMLVGNPVNSWFSAGFQISTTLDKNGDLLLLAYRLEKQYGPYA